MNQESDIHATNLEDEAAIEKIRELAKSARVCLFGTSAGRLPLEVRPMAVQEVDAAGHLWFLSGRSSIKNQHITRDPRVQLLFANVGDSEYLNLHGTAVISDDRSLRQAHWTPLAKTWFNGGVDDPELTVIRVRPDRGYYWDTEHGKAIAMLKITVGSMMGKTMHDGVQGEVRP